MLNSYGQARPFQVGANALEALSKRRRRCRERCGQSRLAVAQIFGVQPTRILPMKKNARACTGAASSSSLGICVLYRRDP